MNNDPKRTKSMMDQVAHYDLHDLNTIDKWLDLKSLGMSQNWNTSVRKEGQKILQTMNERLLASHKKHLQAVALAKELLVGTSYASYHCRPFFFSVILTT